jgi:hypothetical protein
MVSAVQREREDHERLSRPHWLAHYRERPNADPDSIIGDWFTTTLALAFADSRYALKVETGCLVDIVAPPKFDVRALFGFRVPVEVYRARPQRAERGISRHDS